MNNDQPWKPETTLPAIVIVACLLGAVLILLWSAITGD